MPSTHIISLPAYKNTKIQQILCFLCFEPTEENIMLTNQVSSSLIKHYLTC